MDTGAPPPPSEPSFTDAASTAAATYGLALADRVALEAVDPQMREAFALVFPRAELGPRLDALNGLDLAGPEATGFFNNWKGKYFEVLVRDRLNGGRSGGDLTLEPGQHAELAESITQPGWDLRVIDANGETDAVIQLKATHSPGLVYEALRRYPDVPVMATDEVGAAYPDDAIMASGIRDADLERRLVEPVDALFDTPFENALEAALPWLPFALILAGVGIAVARGSATPGSALRRGAWRTVLCGAGITAGVAAVALGLGAASVAVAAGVRLALGWGARRFTARAMRPA